MAVASDPEGQSARARNTHTITHEGQRKSHHTAHTGRRQREEEVDEAGGGEENNASITRQQNMQEGEAEFLLVVFPPHSLA